MCVTVYSVGPAEVVDPLIYDGLVEELVEVLEIKGSDIVVRTNTSTVVFSMFCNFLVLTGVC